jgi:hypothetical protein|uniref:Uncharacterized protein n=1 Tax=viral metagenome TaxID=1070528 RepID=A0A6C0H1C1_9ZZZZ
MGVFSWIAQDTKQPIYINGYQKPGYEQRTYYMWDNNGNSWKEPSYEGYGIFGGKDYYILLAEMNRVYGDNVSDEIKREDGIHIVFECSHDGILFPNLTESSIWTWTNNEPNHHYNQGCYEDYDDIRNIYK